MRFFMFIGISLGFAFQQLSHENINVIDTTPKGTSYFELCTVYKNQRNKTNK